SIAGRYPLQKVPHRKSIPLAGGGQNRSDCQRVVSSVEPVDGARKGRRRILIIGNTGATAAPGNADRMRGDERFLAVVFKSHPTEIDLQSAVAGNLVDFERVGTAEIDRHRPR